MRALLDLLRENETTVHDIRVSSLEVLHEATQHLKVLDPERGDQELIKSVKARLASLKT